MKDGRASGTPARARLGWSLRARGKFNGLRGLTPQRRKGRERCPPPLGRVVANATLVMGQGLLQPIVNLYSITAWPCARPRSGSRRHWFRQGRVLLEGVERLALI